MNRFDIALYLILTVWSLPFLMAAVMLVRCWRDVRREDRLRADIVAAGASPVQARALLTLVREEAS